MKGRGTNNMPGAHDAQKDVDNEESEEIFIHQGETRVG